MIDGGVIMGFGYPYGGYIEVDPFVEESMNFAGSAVAGVGGFLLIFVLLIYLMMFAFAIVAYVLQSIGMYSIAKRRGINHPWLSWLPLGDAWILGSISDQYNYVAKGKVRNRRKVLLGLSIAALGALVPMFLIGMIGIVLGAATGGLDGEAVISATVAVMLLTYLVIIVLLIILAVFRYFALYDLYVSCEPGNGVLYLVLSIFLSVTMPFLIFFSRNKDLGMPPKKQPQPEALPVTETEASE